VNIVSPRNLSPFHEILSVSWFHAALRPRNFECFTKMNVENQWFFLLRYIFTDHQIAWNISRAESYDQNWDSL